ncbi:MAG: acyl carrier protein [Thermoguttaceae bacterium]|nr:acyl carrier protein [Thermoguttaceae bacterium]
MTAPEIRDAIIGILSDIAPDEDYDNLKDDVSFREQLSMDSMDMLDIVLELRRRYKLQIPEEDYPHLDSMKSTLAYLEPLLKDQ